MTALMARTGDYSVAIGDRDAVEAAQRLRRVVFADQFGHPRPRVAGERDVDEYDERADHLIVRHEPTGAVVGTYRMMRPRGGRRFGDRTFDRGRLAAVDDDLVEAGRSCVHPDHRRGAVMSLLWAGIGGYLRQSGHGWLGGCFWVPLLDGGREATRTWDALRREHLAPLDLRVRPRPPLELGLGGEPGPGPIAPLLRGYLRLGSWIAGAPAYDKEAGVAAFYVLLSLDRMPARYRRHFLGRP